MWRYLAASTFTLVVWISLSTDPKVCVHGMAHDTHHCRWQDLAQYTHVCARSNLSPRKCRVPRAAVCTLAHACRMLVEQLVVACSLAVAAGALPASPLTLRFAHASRPQSAYMVVWVVLVVLVVHDSPGRHLMVQQGTKQYASEGHSKFPSWIHACPGEFLHLILLLCVPRGSNPRGR